MAPAPGACTTPNDSTHGNKPCTTVTAVTNPPSLAARLTVGGSGVALSTLKGTTDGTVATVPQAAVAAVTSESKLTAV